MRESDKRNADHHTSDDTPVLARRDFLKTAGVVVVGIGVANASSAQAPAGGSGAWQRGLKVSAAGSGGGRFLRRNPSKQYRDDLPRLRRSRAGRPDCALSDRRGGARSRIQSGVDCWKRHLCVHERLHSGQPDSRDRRNRNARGRRRGASCASRSGLGAAESVRAGPDRSQGRRVREGCSTTVGDLRRVAGRQTVRREVRGRAL